MSNDDKTILEKLGDAVKGVVDTASAALTPVAGDGSKDKSTTSATADYTVPASAARSKRAEAPRVNKRAAREKAAKRSANEVASKKGHKGRSKKPARSSVTKAASRGQKSAAKKTKRTVAPKRSVRKKTRKSKR